MSKGEVLACLAYAVAMTVICIMGLMAFDEARGADFKCPDGTCRPGSHGSENYRPDPPSIVYDGVVEEPPQPAMQVVGTAEAGEKTSTPKKEATEEGGWRKKHAKTVNRVCFWFAVLMTVCLIALYPILLCKWARELEEKNRKTTLTVVK